MAHFSLDDVPAPRELPELRAAFHAFVKSQGRSVVQREGEYIEYMTRLWWTCWQAAIAESEARAEDARDAAKKVLLKIAAQFDEMAQACQHEDEYTRRDVWLNAAHQARKRTEHPCWIDAAIAQEAEREAASG